jgi:hypothetical protein
MALCPSSPDPAALSRQRAGTAADQSVRASNAVTLTTEATSDVTPPSVPTNVRIVGSFGCPEFFVGWA